MTDTASKKYKFNTATGRTGAKKYEDGEAPPTNQPPPRTAFVVEPEFV